MEQIVSEVAEKLGLDHETAEHAVQIVVDHLKRMLPAPVAEQIDSVLASDQKAEAGTAAISVGGIMKKLFGS